MIKTFINEFKKFAMRGNVIDMAVGIIIGAAFGKIVDSLVKDIIMPPIGLLLGSVDFTNIFFVLKDVPGHEGAYSTLAQAASSGAVTLNIGNFLNTLVSFLIVAFAVFLLIKTINNLQAKLDKSVEEEACEITTKTCPYCFTVVPMQATKCSACTSELKAEKVKVVKKEKSAKPAKKSLIQKVLKTK